MLAACSVCACHMAFSVFTSGNARILGFRFELQSKACSRRRTHLVTAQLSNHFSFNFGLDSQSLKSIQVHDSSRLRWVGPVPGDIAEIEAYCRIFRNSERLHSALMDALYNPLTGECSVSYEVPFNEKPLLKDKIVSVLGCMVALVNKGREDVLAGRSAVMTPFLADGASTTEETMPPLAVFRSEMKRCCESLHVALENYLISGDCRSLDVWRRLQRLKNVCYDSGFPRSEDYPCPALFANWSPVYLFNSKEEAESKESEAAFWMGGQVTEEGLKWLLDKGYKTIIDLREETVKDNFYQADLYDAISSGSIELVKIPVEVRTAPTMEQVKRFASYVSDCSKRPIYLHSKEGVWRTSSMVSRWREYMILSASQYVSNQAVTSNGMLLDYTNGSGELQDSMITERSSLQKDNNLLQESLSATYNSIDSFDPPKKNTEKAQSSDALSGIIPDDRTSSQATASDGEGSYPSFFGKTIPLDAQVPPCHIFSKKEMSKFWGSRKISKPYFNYQVEPRNMHTRRQHERAVISGGNNPEPKIVGPAEISNGSVHVDVGEPHTTVSRNWKLVNVSTSSSVRTTVNGFSERETYYRTDANDIDNATTNSQRIGDDEDKAREGLEHLERDMCASSTGVVRVQSRKKAEMFLVRTDGYSCAREKVTESSLAFTHPSTQQQMLLWKSTPKTVLLLKKPGERLMEEAKEMETKEDGFREFYAHHSVGDIGSVFFITRNAPEMKNCEREYREM